MDSIRAGGMTPTPSVNRTERAAAPPPPKATEAPPQTKSFAPSSSAGWESKVGNQGTDLSQPEALQKLTTELGAAIDKGEVQQSQLGGEDALEVFLPDAAEAVPEDAPHLGEELENFDTLEDAEAFCEAEGGDDVPVENDDGSYSACEFEPEADLEEAPEAEGEVESESESDSEMDAAGDDEEDEDPDGEEEPPEQDQQQRKRPEQEAEDEEEAESA